MKKYRMAVSGCGPRIIYTKLYKAKSPEEAARQYLEENYQEFTDEDIKDIAARMHEKESRVVRNKDQNMQDCLGTEVVLGDRVIAICKSDKNALKIGEVVDVKPTYAVVRSDTGATSRVITSTNDGITLAQVIKLNLPTEPIENNDIPHDAAGRVISIGDRVAIRRPVYMDSCYGFDFGTVTNITKAFVDIKNSETGVVERRKHNLTIVL